MLELWRRTSFNRAIVVDAASVTTSFQFPRLFRWLGREKAWELERVCAGKWWTLETSAYFLFMSCGTWQILRFKEVCAKLKEAPSDVIWFFPKIQILTLLTVSELPSIFSTTIAYGSCATQCERQSKLSCPTNCLPKQCNKNHFLRS